MTAPHQRPLQADGLVEGEPLAGTTAFGRVFGEMDAAQRLILGDQPVMLEEALRQRIWHRVQHLDHLAHAREDVPALQLAAGRVDRIEASFERVDQHLPADGLRGVGNAAQRIAAAILAVRRIEDQERRMRQLHGAAKESDLPRQHHLGAFDQPFLDEAGIEESRGDLAAAGPDGHDQNFVFGAFLDRSFDHAGDGVDDGDVLTFLGTLVG